MAREMKDSGIEWIGKIPEEWSVVSLGRLFSASAGGDAKQELYSDYQDETHPYPVYTNTLSKDQVYAYTTTPFFQSNTITVTGRGAIGHAFYRDTPYDAIIRLLSLCPKQTLNCRFYAYWIDTVIPFFTDSAAIGQLSAIQITKYKTLFLPLREQDKISEYLDIECSKINTIIEQTRASIEEYKKLKQSVITQAVTKGIHPGRKMKDSGIEWVGEIPEEWTVSTILSHITFEGGSQPPLTQFIHEPREGYVRLIQNRDYKTDAYITYVPVRSVSKFCEEDDVMIGRYGPPVFVLHRGIKGAYNVALMKAVPVDIDREFMAYVLQEYTLIKYVESFSKRAAGQDGVNPQILKKYPLCLPNRDEQIEIVTFLNEKCAEIDSIIAGKENLIDCLENYKKSLIFEYVTGQKEVH